MSIGAYHIAQLPEQPRYQRGYRDGHGDEDDYVGGGHNPHVRVHRNTHGGGQKPPAPGAEVPGPNVIIPGHGHAFHGPAFEAHLQNEYDAIHGHGHLVASPASQRSYATARSNVSFVTAQGSRSRSRSRSRASSQSSRSSSHPSRSPPSPGAPGLFPSNFPGANSAIYPEASEGYQGSFVFDGHSGAPGANTTNLKLKLRKHKGIKKSKKSKGKKINSKGSKGKGKKGSKKRMKKVRV